MNELGVYLIHGIPKCGKSPRARRIAVGMSMAHQIPLCVIDPARVWTFADMAHVDVKQAAEMLKHGRHCAVSDPDPDRIDWLAGEVGKFGRCVLLVDETRFYASQYYVSANLVILARTFQHLKLGLVFVTQRINDIHGDVRSCVTEVHTGRCTSPRILKYLAQEQGLNPGKVKALPVNAFYVQREGF